MDFPVKLAAPLRQRTACAIVPVFTTGALPAVTASFNAASRGRIAAMRKSGEISGRLGTTHWLQEPRGTAATRLLIVGCGPRSEFAGKALYRAVTAASQALAAARLAEAISYLAYDTGTDAYYAARLSVEAASAATYTFNELKSEPEPAAKLRRLGIAIQKAAAEETRRGIDHGRAIAAGVAIARDLGNRPPNVCTPTHIAETAARIAHGARKLTSKVLSEKEIRKLDMGALLSVTSGAAEPVKLVVMRYEGAGRKSRPVALCGKGVTFDTGGISLKPPPKMDEMKFDMCGAASVIGTMAAIAALELEINVLAVVPCCENMPSGTATRPGDIVTSMSGKTIEVLNTDAEGRLILCDALTYAQQDDPRCIIDVATLTGACVIALGSFYSGVFANDKTLCDALIAAGERSLDAAWPMPADDEYGESLKSNFADFANVGSRDGGASVAAAFLRRFIDKGRSWAHLDIAGVAWKGDANKGATGRPVALLVDYLLQLGS